MNFTDLRRVLPALIMNAVEKNRRMVSIELRSPPGRGKSDFTYDLVDMLSAKTGKKWGFAEMFLATQTPPDLIGFVFKGSITGQHGEAIATSEPTLPSWMITRDGKPVWEYEHGICFLDEYGQGQADVKASAAQLLLKGSIGKHQLPKGWIVIAASNRASDRSGVTKSLDFVINRRLEIDIADDLQSWEDWAFSHGVEPLFISFANQNPNVVFSDGVPEKQGPWCTPRSLVMASELLDGMRDADGKIPTDKTALELCSGMIGQAATAALMAHVKLGHEMPSLDDIIKDPMKTKCPTKPDAGILVTYNLAARVNEKNCEPIVKYMRRMPKEFAVTFAKAACRRDATLIFQDAFVEWSSENASLMTALSDHK
jgi:hypothetical protein